MGLADLLLPARCAVCGADGTAACERCLADLWRLRPPLCRRCGAPTAWPVSRCRECSGRRLAFASARAAVVYEGGARQLIAAWKERGLRGLGKPAAEVVAATVERPAVDALVWVPPDRERLRERGHHPAESLARELGRLWHIPQIRALRRVRAGERQRGLTLQARRRNVAGAFVSASTTQRVALVDDVYTTGATAAAAASALRRAGARGVVVVTFARAIRPP